MAQGRFLFKRISMSKKMAKLSNDTARLFYTWLLAHLDKNGCFYADPRILRNIVFPRLDISIKEIENYLDELEEIGSIIRWKNDDEEYLWYPDFREKQPYLRPEREERVSVIPAPPRELQKSVGVVLEECWSSVGVTPDQLPKKRKRKKKKNNKKKRKKKSLKQLQSLRGTLFDDEDLLILKTFYKLGYTCLNGDEKELSAWLEEISKEFPDINFSQEIKKFEEYWEVQPRKLKTHKLAWRNWLNNCRKYAKDSLNR